MMNKLKVVAYDSTHKRAWDDFITNSKNGVFLFYRDYMEYHADRFPDGSLMFFDGDGQLVAILPATVRDGVLSSHAGLTFGGVVSGMSMKVAQMLCVFDSMTATLRERGINKIIYKAIPHIYHRVPAEEDLYALFRCGARLVRRDVSTTIELRERLPFSKDRKGRIKLGEKHGLEVRRSFDFERFMKLVEQLLGAKYGAKPVHTAAELRLLAERFPDNIKLFAAYKNSEMYAGVIIYESQQVAHTQYIGTSHERRKTGAQDLLLNYLINDYYAHKKYFDFGISTEDDGRRLNAGLIENKQGFGARAVVYDAYEIDLQQ
jgi:hypothetical protein